LNWLNRLNLSGLLKFNDDELEKLTST